MQPHKPTEQIAERHHARLARRTLACCGLLVLGCSSSPRSDAEESGNLPDVPADLPSEPIEYEGIIHGVNFNAEPTQFWECKTGEKFEMAYGDWDNVWKGSCWGVYQRVRGQLDRNYDPPRLLIEETLEARWSTPEDCSFFDEPDYKSCAIEDNPDSEFPKTSCPPDEDLCLHDDRCSPVRFGNATEYAGWKTFDCVDMPKPALAGPFGVCEFSGDLDTCIDTYRCWNPDGDLALPGVCMPYCDLNDAADPCTGTGTCVRCSASDRWGLCLPNCSGEECHVDAFC